MSHTEVINVKSCDDDSNTLKLAILIVIPKQKDGDLMFVMFVLSKMLCLVFVELHLSAK